jgi:hypothetical protein
MLNIKTILEKSIFEYNLNLSIFKLFRYLIGILLILKNISIIFLLNFLYFQIFSFEVF